jgi:ribonuclease HI
MIRIYTDGAARNNPGVAGWGAIVINDTSKTVVELGGHVRHATNNAMELTAALEALTYVHAQVKDRVCALYTDSSYVINGMKQWVHGWEKNNWRNSEKEPVANKELWQALVKHTQTIQVEWLYVKGHAGIPLNERADTIATCMADKTPIELFRGKASAYGVSLEDVPHTLLVQKKPSQSKTKTGYYISVVNGAVTRHDTWESCKEAVHGVKNVYYKKVADESEEKAFLAKVRA